MSSFLKGKWNCPKLIAHRGAGKDAPENTLSAFQLGADSGYNMFECDVKLSKDQELFLLHDATLDRTTNLQGLAKAYDWHELIMADAGAWHSKQYKGEKLLKFTDLVDFIIKNHFRLDVEVKPNEGQAYETGAAVARFLQQRMRQKIDQYVEYFFTHEPINFFTKLHDALLDQPEPYCLQNQFLISSFEPEALRGAKDTVSKIPRALLIDDFSKGEDLIWQQLEILECQGIIINYQILTSEFLKRCHEAERFVMVYTVNDLDKINQLLNLGVDSVITDNMRALNALGYC